jgi:hypothetical protein
MAFTDALVDHADVSVVMVDRGTGRWALATRTLSSGSQASSFYGVASTLLGGGSLQHDGPEPACTSGRPRRNLRVLRTVLRTRSRLRKVCFYPNCDYSADVVSRVSMASQGARRRRIVDARYLSPSIPATTPPPYGIADGVTAVPVNDLVTLGGAPSEYVIAGSGKTATDACIWLLDNGVDPGAICWVRPRDPWMLNRAVVQPDPVLFIGTAADIMEAAAAASAADDVFFQLRTPACRARPVRDSRDGKIAALAHGAGSAALIGRVVQLGHLRHVQPGRLVSPGRGRHRPGRRGRALRRPGLSHPPLVPVWSTRAILAAHRITFACFGGAGRLRRGDARGRRGEEPALPACAVLQHNRRLGAPGCSAVRRRPSPLTPPSGTGPTVRSTRTRPPELAGSAAVTAAQERLARRGAGHGQAAQLAGMA